MTARLAAAEALILTPFVLGCLFIIVCAVAWTVRFERRLRERRLRERRDPLASDYLAPWRDRRPGDIGGGAS